MTLPRFRCAAVVTDIEGTTGSIAFVRDVLFPYARERIDSFIEANKDNVDVARAMREAAVLAADPFASAARIGEILRRWIDEDRKATPLKTLQGYIWAEGYARGTLAGHIYADAAAGLKRWHGDGLALYVYSSGSIEAQKLLFKHSAAGDLTPLFRGYFDTTIGAKIDAGSYGRIATQIGTTPANILFLSDSEAELEAAYAAGWQIVLITRNEDQAPRMPNISTTPGALPSRTDRLSREPVDARMVRSFDEITITFASGQPS